jgi:YfiH family protein
VKCDTLRAEEVNKLLNKINNINAIQAGFSTRNDGNLALHVGDDPRAVIARREKFAAAAGFDFSAWTCADQVHGIDIARVGLTEVGAGRHALHDKLDGYDGLLTNVPGVMLVSFYADCVPLYFVDPVKRVVGLAHAGWKGTVRGIAAEMVHQMVRDYGCRAEDMLAAIGPAIGPCCYEVDDTVINAINEQLGRVVYQPGKAMVDLKKINQEIMIREGILSTNIDMSASCTSCQINTYFSHRAEQGKTGRMASWIGIQAEA